MDISTLVHDRDYLALNAYMDERPKILDVGANSGQSIRSFKALRPGAIIDSFEPNPVLHNQLEMVSAQFPDGVTLHFCALGNVESHLKFYTPVVDGVARLEESSMFLSEFEKPWIKQRLEDAGKNLSFSEFFADVKLGDTFQFKPNIIKIDVEGAELNALKGLNQTILDHQPVLLVENSDFGNVTDHLRSLSYLPTMPDESGYRVIPFRGQRTNTLYLPLRLHHSISPT